MKMSRSGAAIAAATLFSSAASAQSLQPSGKWVINYAEAQCVASRPFGSGADAIHLTIKPSPTSDVIQLALVKDGKSSFGVQRQGEIKFGSFPEKGLNFLEFGTSQNKQFTSVNLPQELAGQLSQSQSVEWRVRGEVTTLNTGPMAEVMKVMANCRADLRDYWNIEPSKSESLRAQVKTVRPLVKYFSTDDYPAQAVDQRESGMTSVVLLVDEKGLVQDCMVDGTSGIATLDAMTCIILRKRGKFEPAIDHAGIPTKGSFSQRVRWEMP